jgi:multidrug efflux system outer membrane protein
LDAQAQILQDTVAAFAEQVRVVGAQLRNGLVSPIDLYQAQSLYEATRAQLSDVQRARANAEHALAVICGQPAPTFSVAVRPLQEAAPPAVPVGLPGDLLKRRPDVAMSEQNVVSFNAQVGVATAELYPTFTLTGTAGFESTSLSHLLDWKSRMLSIGPSVSIPISDAGRRRYNLAAVKAQYQQSVAAYVSQVLVAYSDVEDALTDLHALTDEVERMRAAVAASQNYVNTALAQYKQGLVTYLIVIDAQRTLLSNQLTLSQDINLQMSASIHLIKALGGGWDAQAAMSAAMKSK